MSYLDAICARKVMSPALLKLVLQNIVPVCIQQATLGACHKSTAKYENLGMLTFNVLLAAFIV